MSLRRRFAHWRLKHFGSATFTTSRGVKVTLIREDLWPR